MAASKGGKAKKGARRARKAAPKPGARAGKGCVETNKGAAAAGGAVKPDEARVRAWRLRGGIGVYWDENKKRWKAHIHYGKQLHLGSFKTEEDAHASPTSLDSREHLQASAHRQRQSRAADRDGQHTASNSTPLAWHPPRPRNPTRAARYKTRWRFRKRACQ